METINYLRANEVRAFWIDWSGQCHQTLASEVRTFSTLHPHPSRMLASERRTC